jgi:hypothetical protein
MEPRHADAMDDTEVKRLRREICRSFNSSPHKKKYWLALLDMYLVAERRREAGGRNASGESSGSRSLNSRERPSVQRGGPRGNLQDVIKPRCRS